MAADSPGQRPPGSHPASTRRATSPETEVRRPDGTLLFVDTLRLSPARGDDPNGCGASVRLLGARSKVVRAALRTAWSAARLALIGTPAPDLRKG